MKKFKNANILTSDFTFRSGSFAVEDGKFVQVCGDFDDRDAVDLGGSFVIPGLVDVHNHGNSGADFSDGDSDGLKRMARYLASVGVTSFAPASMTLPEETLEKAFLTARELSEKRPEGASVLRGINMEGPFFNPAKKGAQNGKYLKDPDYDFFSRLNEKSGGLVRIMDVAPELPGAVDFIGRVKDTCTVSVAHTEADYDTAKAAFDAGARHVTHLFNAMPPFHHRKPGVIGAAAENPLVRAEMICDGVHLHASTIRAAFAMFGADRICIVSDAMSACGMPDGQYMLGGQEVTVRGRLATLADGTIAGSATNLFDCMRTTISFGIRPEDAVRAASWNPARQIGADGEVGSIEDGKTADFLVCGGDFALKDVYLAGKKLA